MIIIPKNFSRWISDASIDTEAWLDSVAKRLDLQIDATWDDHPSIVEAINHSRASRGLEGVAEYRCRDNVYNYETDFNQIFTFTLYTVSESSDYFYDSEAYLAVCLHRGGDARANYSAPVVYKLKECPAERFYHCQLSWTVTDAETNEDLDRKGYFSAGYCQYPTSELERIILESDADDDDKLNSWQDGSYLCRINYKDSITDEIQVRIAKLTPTYY